MHCWLVTIICVCLFKVRDECTADLLELRTATLSRLQSDIGSYSASAECQQYKNKSAAHIAVQA